MGQRLMMVCLSTVLLAMLLVGSFGYLRSNLDKLPATSLAAIQYPDTPAGRLWQFDDLAKSLLRERNHNEGEQTALLLLEGLTTDAQQGFIRKAAVISRLGIIKQLYTNPANYDRLQIIRQKLAAIP